MFFFLRETRFGKEQKVKIKPKNSPVVKSCFCFAKNQTVFLLKIAAKQKIAVPVKTIEAAENLKPTDQNQ
jgi:hypothetical protein